MSAFICHPCHLEYVARATIAYSTKNYTKDDSLLLAKKLSDINIVAMQDRYGDKLTKEELIYEPCISRRQLEPGQALNAINCYIYQVDSLNLADSQEYRRVIDAHDNLIKLGVEPSGEWELVE